MRSTLDLCQRIVANQLRNIEAFVTTVQEALGEHAPTGSYIAEVTDRARAIVEPAEDAALFVILQMTEAVERAVFNVRDRAVTFQAGISDARRPTTSLMTLARSMLEGTLVVAHLLEPIGPDMTLTRGMAYWLDILEGTLRTLRHLPASIGPGTGHYVNAR